MAKLFWTWKRHFGPPPRILHAMAFDSHRARTMLFGGLAPETASRFGDTWMWNGESWTQVDDIGPTPRSEMALVYDEARDRTVLFGGFDGTAACNDTWEWNGEDWTQMADNGPSARLGHRMVFDNNRKRVLLFGGEFAGVELGDTWEWEGKEWVQVEDSGPSARHSHAMAFDKKRKRAVLFGGISGGVTLGDTWEWENSVWTKAAHFGPAPALHGAMMYNGRRVLYFGGVTATSELAKVLGLTWEWDGRHWTVRQDLGPGPRWGHAIAFDSARKRGVLFGGTAAPTTQSMVSGDTYEQFEDGVQSSDDDDMLEDLLAEPITVVPAEPMEGQLLTIMLRFKSSAPAATELVVALKNALGGDPLAEYRIEIGGLNEMKFPFVLESGNYAATITRGEAQANLSFTVKPSGVVLLSLVVEPKELPPNTPLTLTATLRDPAPIGGITVPLRLKAGSNPEFVLFGANQLLISAGQITGAVILPGDIFKYFPRPLQLFCSGSLGGNRTADTVALV